MATSRGQENSETGVGSAILNKRINRRGFNKGLVAVAAAAVTLEAGWWAGRRSEVDAINTKLDSAAVKLELFGRKAKGALERIGFNWNKGKVGGVLIESYIQAPPEGFELLMPNLSVEEKSVLFDLKEGRIPNAGREVLSKFNYGTEQGIRNISMLLSLEEKIWDKISGSSDKRISGFAQVTSEYLTGLAAAESGGDPLAESDAGAAGIFQLMPHIAETMGMTVVRDKNDSERFIKDERFDVDKSTDAILRYIAEEDERFGNLGYDLQAVHDGAPNLYAALKRYVESNYGYSLPNPGFDVDFGSEESNQREIEREKDLYRGVIAGTMPLNNGETVRPVTIYHLIEDDSTRAMFEENDLGSEYLYRTIASMMIMQELKIQIGKLAKASKAA